MTKIVKITKRQTVGNINFIVKWDDITGISGKIKSSINDKPIKDAKILFQLWTKIDEIDQCR
jgi:hypothetical protein